MTHTDMKLKSDYSRSHSPRGNAPQGRSASIADSTRRSPRTASTRSVGTRVSPREAWEQEVWWSFGVLLLAWTIALPGCGAKSNAPAPTKDAAAKPARSEVEQGPVRLTVDVQPPKARLSDELALTLTIDYEQGVALEKPAFGSELGAFTIRDFREPLPKIAGGRETLQQIYTLEPTEAGRLKIDPIAVKFTDRRPKGDGKSHTISSEAVTVEITTALDDRAPSLGELHPPAGPLELLTRGLRWPWVIVALAAFVLAAAAWRWLRPRKKRQQAAVARILSPEELANLELDRLVESGLAERDIKQFYVELTGIVRRYIERTTGIRAPEQTTEEFLREISRAQTFGRDECSRLGDFLESADLVKFAAHQPRVEDIDEGVRRARVFVATKTQSPVPNPEVAVKE